MKIYCVQRIICLRVPTIAIFWVVMNKYVFFFWGERNATNRFYSKCDTYLDFSGTARHKTQKRDRPVQSGTYGHVIHEFCNQ